MGGSKGNRDKIDFFRENARAPSMSASWGKNQLDRRHAGLNRYR